MLLAPSGCSLSQQRPLQLEGDLLCQDTLKNHSCALKHNKSAGKAPSGVPAFLKDPNNFYKQTETVLSCLFSSLQSQSV